MRVYAVQHDIVWEDQAANCRSVSALLEKERPDAGSLVVLPEMFSTGFSMDPGASVARAETLDFLSRLACSNQVYLLAGVVSIDESGVSRNEAVLWNPDGLVGGRYVKQRGFTMGGESSVYTTGDSHVVLVCGEIRIAPFICYDLRFPELFRPTVAEGAELLVLIASWPDARIQHWRHLLRARAIENQCYVIGVNRVGSDPALNYSGQSLVIDYQGEIVVDGGEREGVITSSLDFLAQREYRAKLPFLQDG